MARTVNGIWEIKQLFPHVKEIVSKYAENFNGVSVSDIYSSLVIDGEETESDLRRTTELKPLFLVHTLIDLLGMMCVSLFRFSSLLVKVR